MKLGMFMMPLHPPEKDRTECFEEDIELVVHADELGFTDVWVGQHHSAAWENPFRPTTCSLPTCCRSRRTFVLVLAW